MMRDKPIIQPEGNLCLHFSTTFKFTTKCCNVKLQMLSLYCDVMNYCKNRGEKMKIVKRK